jgi:hypothetical protein
MNNYLEETSEKLGDSPAFDLVVLLVLSALLHKSVEGIHVVNPAW